MVQPYPSSGKPIEAVRPPAPAPVQNAVKLMYVGAAITTVYTIVSIVAIGTIKNELKRADHTLTASQLNTDARFFVTSSVVFGVITIGLWLWMAWANKGPRNWARIVATIFFGLNTVYMFGIIAQTRSIVLILPVLTWLVGAGAVFLLWRAESSAFFKPRSLL
ncbi:MAG: hypothetical protein ACRDOH_30400 [Streptosporangiaceae bacterium]